jgi:hypothetical protein
MARMHRGKRAILPGKLKGRELLGRLKGRKKIMKRVHPRTVGGSRKSAGNRY